MVVAAAEHSRMLQLRTGDWEGRLLLSPWPILHCPVLLSVAMADGEQRILSAMGNSGSCPQWGMVRAAASLPLSLSPQAPFPLL
jgi:hypothetical protein